MIGVKNVETFGWMAAIRGMRNSYNSWDNSDSELKDGQISIGPNDLRLMQKLYMAGPSHRKYLRMIHVQMDVTAPLYWWKEFDTYKVGTTENSTSTMHKIMDHKLTIDDFSYEHLDIRMRPMLEATIKSLNDYIDWYINYNPDELEMKGVPPKKMLWWQVIQMLPESYNQLRTIDMNYENVFTIIQQRQNHKLDEWKEFVLKLWDLSYVREIAGKGDTL